jgi:hypothetical protein
MEAELTKILLDPDSEEGWGGQGAVFRRSLKKA